MFPLHHMCTFNFQASDPSLHSFALVRREGLQHESALSQWFGAVLSLMAIGKGFFCVHLLWRCPSVKYFLAEVSAAL